MQTQKKDTNELIYYLIVFDVISVTKQKPHEYEKYHN